VRSVDTNVLVRLITRDDVKQVAAARLERRWVLASVYDRDAKAIVTAVEMLLNHQHLTLQDSDAVAAAVERLRRRPATGFSDCLMLEVARKAGHLPLGAFDRDLGRLDGAQKL
jgi:predicted nucleic-acid-binding protein